MNGQRSLALAFALVLASSACGTPERSDREDERASAVAADAMCSEHGVPEALCTLCNPRLIPVFRARLDFCEEHQLPESICPICHPERGGRPTEGLLADDAPADGTRVRLATTDLAEQIGIEVQAAVDAPSVVDVAATARVVYDPARLAQINARLPGVIRAIHVDIGSRVEAGDALVTIASAAVGAERSRIGSSETRLRVAEAALERQTQLEGVTSQRSRLEAERERDEARGEVAALRASLNVIGRTRGSEYTLLSPIAGVVTHREGTLGAFVTEQAQLLSVVDATSVWVELHVPEDEIARVAAGQTVSLALDALGDRRFEGTLSYLAPEVDPHTRTVLARLPLDNPDGALRAAMVGRALVQVPRDGAAVIVARDAVQRARGASLVFVRTAPELYEVRRVEVIERPSDPDRVEVRGRVAAGDEVVVQGAFLLRTETMGESIGAGCCEETPR